MSNFRDGDIIVTSENFVFYAFGHAYPPNRVTAYLKYIPKYLKHLFPLDFQKTEWKIEDQKLTRPMSLYSPENFKKIIETFQKHFPEFLYSCPYTGRTIIAIPMKRVKRVYRPQDSLKRLLQERHLSSLEGLALKLIKLLSKTSNVPLEDFGIHGSIAMGIFSRFSDIDIAIFGGNNFLQVKKGVENLVKNGFVQYFFEEKADEFRMNKGKFEETKFVFNAIRKEEEIFEKYGQYIYQPTKRLNFICKIFEDGESNFKPAVYGIMEYEPLNADSILNSFEMPFELVSMNSQYRGIAKRGQVLKALGMHEKVINTKDNSIKYRVVVGSIGATLEEYLWPVIS